MPESPSPGIEAINPLTKVEKYQLENKSRGLDTQTINAVSWEIGTNPLLYKETISNPYSGSSELRLQEALPDDWNFDRAGVRRSLILAEPEGRYDRQFRDLSNEEKQEALYNEIDTSAEMLMRITKHVATDPQKYWDMTPEEIYEELLDVAFGTTDSDVMDETFSQSQRRGFRLAIVHFIEDMNVIRRYKKGFEEDALVTTNYIVNESIKRDERLDIEVLPFGIIMYVDAADYGLFSQETPHLEENFDSKAVTLFGDHIPEELQGRVVVINNGSETESVAREDLSKSRTHEIQHMLNAYYFSESSQMLEDFPSVELPKITDLKGHRQLAEKLAKHYMSYLKDEAIAYFSTSRDYFIDYQTVAGNDWHAHFRELNSYLKKQDTLPDEEKETIYKQYHDVYTKYLLHNAEYQSMALLLYDQARKEQEQNIPNPLTEEKVTALLQITPPEKILRLREYLDLSNDALTLELEEHRSNFIEEFTNIIDAITTSDAGHEAIAEVAGFEHDGLDRPHLHYLNVVHPIDVLPSLIKAIPVINNNEIVESLLETMATMLLHHRDSLSSSDLSNIKNSLELFCQKRTTDAFYDSNWIAKSLLDTINDHNNTVITQI